MNSMGGTAIAPQSQPSPIQAAREHLDNACHNLTDRLQMLEARLVSVLEPTAPVPTQSAGANQKPGSQALKDDSILVYYINRRASELDDLIGQINVIASRLHV